MDIPQEVIDRVAETIKEQSKEASAERARKDALNVSEPVKQWVKDKEENSLGGKELNPKTISQLYK